MGHHSVPQRYLKAFQAPASPGHIWASDKQGPVCNLLPIKRVAQSPAFYQLADEHALTYGVEVPGGDAIDRLRHEGRLDEAQRRDLTYYIATQIRRVPNARDWFERLVPEAMDDVFARRRASLRSAAAAPPATADTLAARLAGVDALEKRFRARPPDTLREQCETPWPFESWLFAIHSMYWRLLRAKGSAQFLTGDNPAFFFEGFGLANEECELILPLTPELLLHCSWQPCRDLQQLDLQNPLVKEMNRRIIVGATRFVYSHQEVDWVFKVAQNKPAQLTRIRWA